MEFQIISLLVIGGLLSIVGAFLTWKYADFFLARRDYYVNSKFDLLKKKLSMSLGVGGAIIFLTIMVASSLPDKNKKQIEKTKIEIQKPRKKQAHLQFAQANAQTKNCKRACFANAEKIVFKKFPNASKKK